MVTILEQTILHENMNISGLEQVDNAILRIIEDTEHRVEKGLKPLITLINDEDVEIEDSSDLENETLEDELEDQESDDDESTDISYSIIEEEFIARVGYGARQVDYLQLWYGDGKNPASIEFEEEYWSGDVHDTLTYSEMLSDDEATSKFNDFQFGVVVGGQGEISQIERRKMDTWIMFNPSLFKMLETMYSITKEVNYAPLR